MKGKVSDLLSSFDAFSPVAKKLRQDFESDLKSYEITDKTTLKGIHATLMLLDIIEGDLQSAKTRLATVSELEDKEAAQLMGSLEMESHIEADGLPADLYKQTFQRHYQNKIKSFPWHLVSELVKSQKGQAELLSKNLLLGTLDQYLQPMIDSNGVLNRMGAAFLVNTYFAIYKQIPVKEIVISSLQEYINQHVEKKQNIWPARNVDICTFKLHPVTVAIWDTGVDANVYQERKVIKEIENIEYSPELHNIAYDMYWKRSTGPLAPIAEASRPVSEIQADFKGYTDSIAALDTPESQAIRQKISNLAQEEVKPFLEDFGRYAVYSHGTHVCGITLEGNPSTRLITARLSTDPSLIPHAPSIEEALRAATSFKEVVDFFKKHDVRVVNMSWVLAKSSFEYALEANGIGKDPEERKLKAREIFDTYQQGLLDAINSAPEILFVGGAGNSNNNVAFDEYIPSMFALHNLLISGAVDQAGDPTSFTSFGSTVNVYSNGSEIESKVPGGELMKLSGTSMAAPNVTNLALKLLSINPALKPKDVIALIMNGSEERREGDLIIRIINPQHSVKLLTASMNRSAWSL